MRLFVFAIGGTGSRVLSSLVMQLAAGARPKDSNGNPIMDLSVVPIIVDPHEDNGGLQQVKELLDDYRTIRKRIYKDDPKGDGYFGVKIETLKEAEPEGGVSSDNFFFKMNRVSSNSFEKFIGINSMSLENQLFAQMLFSSDELHTEMKEGFYGSPNIGCIALNEFRNSPDFAAFRSAYKDGDRIFFIGSIFGGTGAAGLPLFVSSIRDLGHNDNEDDGQVRCATAPIGALIVMPYFSISQDEDSPINANDFIIKTRSALRYYSTNLNQFINRIYYIADPEGTQDFKNDPGNVDNQKGNKAHIVEFAGALAMFDFLSEDKDNLKTDNDASGRIIVDNQGRIPCKEYGLQTEDSFIHFGGLAAQTNRLVMKPLMSFYMLRYFMTHNLKDMLEKPFAKNHSPKIEKSVFENREVKDLFEKFDVWMAQMKDHGANAHNLDVCSSVRNENFAGTFYDQPNTKKGFWGGKIEVKVKDIQRSLDDAANVVGDKESQESRWYSLAWYAMENIIKDKYDISTLV